MTHRPTCSTPSCKRRPWGDVDTCGKCRQRNEHNAAMAAGSIPRRELNRTPEEERRVAGLVAYLSTLSKYELARYCELVLAQHHEGIEVRPERRRKRRAA